MSAPFVRGLCLALLAASAQAAVPSARTTTMYGSGDVADGINIWIHPTEATRSVVLGSNKSEDEDGGLYAFNVTGGYLTGSSWQAGVNWFCAGQKINVADVRYNFPAGEETWDIVATANRTDQNIDLYRVEKNASGDFVGLSLVGSVHPAYLGGDYPYGLTLFHSQSQGKFYAVTSDKAGIGEQIELTYNSVSGLIEGTSVWHGNISGNGSEVEGIIADDENEVVYIAAEDVAIWRYPTVAGVIQSARVTVDTVASPNISADIEGITLYYTSDGRGYLIASSQAEGRFVVYNRPFNGSAANEHLWSFTVTAGNGIDGVSETDDIDVTNVNLGGAFAGGMFLAHDGSGASPTNFKLVAWSDIADDHAPNLLVDTGWDPRAVVATPTLYWQGAAAGWTDVTNWSGRLLPTGAGTLVFDERASMRTVDLQASVRPGHAIRFQGPAGGYELTNGTLQLGPHAGAGPRIEQTAAVAGVNTISAQIDAPGLDVYVGGGTLRLGGFADANGIALAGRLELDNSAGTASDCQDLTLLPGGLLDLGRSCLLIRGGSPATVLAEVVQGRGSGAWDGAEGITSASAAGDPSLAVGVRTEGAGVYAAVTLLGDADVDRDVDYEDFKRVLQSFGIPGAVWSDADFDYDGDVDYEDYKKVLQNFGAAWTGTIPPAEQSVPEPGTLALLLAAAGALLRRRQPAGGGYRGRAAQAAR